MVGGTKTAGPTKLSLDLNWEYAYHSEAYKNQRFLPFYTISRGDATVRLCV